MLFDNLSPKTDFSSKINIQLDILMKNVLYCTHELDKIKKIVTTFQHDHALYQQALDYYLKDFDYDAKELPPNINKPDDP